MYSLLTTRGTYFQKKYLGNRPFKKSHFVRGHAKFMGYTGLVQMGYGARTVSAHINNGAGTLFMKHIYGDNTFLFIFMNYFLTLDTICADNKDKPMAGCKNQLIEKCLRNL